MNSLQQDSTKSSVAVEIARSGSVVALAICYVLFKLQFYHGLKYLMQALALLVLVIMLPSARGMPRRVSVVLLALGSILMWRAGADAATWLSGLGQNVVIIAILVFTPQLAIPLRFERYMSALAGFYRTYVNTSGRLCLFSMFFTHFLGIILNFGSVPLVCGLVKDNLKKDNLRPVLAAINRGFATSIMWSPYFAAMALVPNRMGVSWASILPVCFSTAMICLLFSFLLDCRGRCGKGGGEGRPPLDSENRGALASILAAGLGGSLSILSVEWLTGIDMVIIVCFAATAFPFLWGLKQEYRPVYRSEIKRHLTETVPMMKNESILFLSSGFFGSSVAASGWGDYLSSGVQLIAGYSFFLAQLAIIMTMVLLAVAGVHPVVSASVLVATLYPPVGGFTPQSLAVILLISWSLSIMSSPFTAVNMLLAGLAGKTPVEVGLKWNISYVLLAGLFAAVFLTIN